MQEDDRQLVIQALGSLPAERFAVVDGAHFDDLPKELGIWQLEHKALYLEKLGETPSTAGPYLVALPDWEAANRVLSLVAELPAVVFWSWPDGQPSLYKHLRRINMIEIPVDDYDPELPKFDRVLFRHGDPNVMSSMLSLLNEGQFSQMLGGAAGLVMFARDEGGLRVAQRITEMGSDRQGILRISKQQYEEIEKMRVAASRKRINSYLRRHLPPPLENISDAKLNGIVISAETRGKELGFKSERGHARWAYLVMMSNGSVSKSDDVHRLFKRNGADPDNDVKHLIDMSATMIKSGVR